MARGGHRPNAGRKPGVKNRQSLAQMELAAQDGELPLETLLGIMRDSSQPVKIRLEAAKAAAPFVHSRLAAISVDVSTDEMSHEEWVQTLS